LIFGLFKALFNLFLVNIKYKLLNKLQRVKYEEIIDRFDALQNPMGK